MENNLEAQEIYKTLKPLLDTGYLNVFFTEDQVFDRAKEAFVYVDKKLNKVNLSIYPCSTTNEVIKIIELCGEEIKKLEEIQKYREANPVTFHALRAMVEK